MEGGGWLVVTGRQRDATVSRPSDATATNEKMGSAAFDSPDRRVQRDESALMNGCSPARIVLLNKAKLDMRLASAWTQQGCLPCRPLLANEIHATFAEVIREILDKLCSISWKEAVTEPSSEICEPLHAAAFRSLSSAQSSSGVMSPRPTCLASARQGSPSSRCS